MASDDLVRVEGRVAETFRGGKFKVLIEDPVTKEFTKETTCIPAGRLRMNKINIVAGDRVVVELTPYDMTKGRIITRLK